jgi:uncharacterized protein (DUF983 family)
VTQGGLFSGTCPACGQGRIFDGVLSVAEKCSHCGIAFNGDQVGDGFTVPVLLLLGSFIVGAAMYVEFTYNPPFWLHILLWPPLTAGLAIAMTRVCKSFLIVQAYRVRR